EKAVWWSTGWRGGTEAVSPGRRGGMGRRRDGPASRGRTPPPLPPRLHRIANQGLAERPDCAGDAVGGGDHVVEGTLDEVAILVGDDEGRQQLDGVAGVAGDLSQHLVVLEERDRNELAEQSLVCRFQQVPAGLELQRRRRPELDPDHQALAAHRAHEFVTFEQLVEAPLQPLAEPVGAEDEALVLYDFEGGDAGRHGEIVL